jgi:uncharacterized membrane protein YfcA
MDWSTALLGGALAFGLALVATPAGVSGAVLLVPVQVSILHVPSPQVTATNLLFNVISAPGAIATYLRSGAVNRALVAPMLVGTCPGVIVGAFIRVEYLPTAAQFRWVMATILLALGTWLLVGRTRAVVGIGRTGPLSISLAAFVAGGVGGVYGIGGGSILAPLMYLLGYAVTEVAGVTLVTTFVTSLVGVAAFQVLARVNGDLETIAPDWSLGLALGIGGLAGGVLGARLQHRVPDVGLRRLLGGLVALVGLRFLAFG